MRSKNAEHVKLLLDDLAVQLSGGKSMAEGASGLLRGLEMLTAILKAFSTQEAIEAGLGELPDPSPEQLKVWRGIAAQVPAAMAEFLRERMDASSAHLSRATGPKPVPTLEKVSICQQVTTLIGSGCRQGAAIQRVAQRTGRSERSIRRIYEARSTLQTAFTIGEVKQGIASLLGFAADPKLLELFWPQFTE